MKHLFPYFLSLFFLLCSFIFANLFSLSDLSFLSISHAETLPFAIDESKKMNQEELKNKKEGMFLTGIPLFGSDPINGQGFGGDFFLFLNGTRADPFFEYTPYRQKWNLHAYITNKSQKEASVSVDTPYLFNTAWRLRLQIIVADNPNLLYFGKTSATLKNLNYRGQVHRSYSSYESALSSIRPGLATAGEAGEVSDALYNTYEESYHALLASTEKSYLDGVMRVLGGFEYYKNKIAAFDGTLVEGTDATGNVRSVPAGRSLLRQEEQEQGALHLGRSSILFFKAGVIYDTRDFEPDPSQGVFAELSDEYSPKMAGAKFNFNKLFFHANFYQQIFKEYFHRLVFAGRYALNLAQGDIPFFEYQYAWGSEGGVTQLGGSSSLRGYKSSRFLAPLTSFLNFELRWRISELQFWGQNFTFNIAPFVDLGRVWDHVKDYSFQDYKMNAGLGLRVPWNQSTVLSFDYAVSNEDEQFFFKYGNSF
jgi:hypothetical protein